MRKIENVPTGPNHKPKIPVRNLQRVLCYLLQDWQEPKTTKTTLKKTEKNSDTLRIYKCFDDMKS